MLIRVIGRIVVVAVCSGLLAGCVTSPNDPVQLARTFDLGYVTAPASATVDKKSCDGLMSSVEDLCIEKIDKSRKHPVIVYMHGCNGFSAFRMRHLARHAVTVSPNSLARPREFTDCAIGSNKVGIAQMRLAEARYAIEKLRRIEWVDQNKLILAGFSEGAMTTALYEGEGLAAKMIFSSTCTSTNPYFHGLGGPRDLPVLAIRGELDRYHQHPGKRGRHCGELFGDRKNSQSIVLPNMGHHVMEDRNTIKAIDTFLSRLLGS